MNASPHVQKARDPTWEPMAKMNGNAHKNRAPADLKKSPIKVDGTVYDETVKALNGFCCLTLKVGIEKSGQRQSAS